jgi:tetratricopeptide (TPR) repeat protein
MARCARRFVVVAAMLAVAGAARAQPPAGADMALCEGRGPVNDISIQVQACTAVIASAGEPSAVLASAYFRRANTYLASQRYDLAIADYSQALTLLPGDPLLLNNRCWARAVEGSDLAAALADCDEAVRKQPRSAAAHNSRGFVLLRLGRFDAAIGDYDASLKVNTRPNQLRASSLYGRGVAEEKKGDVADGDIDIRLAETISPRIVETFFTDDVTP